MNLASLRVDEWIISRWLPIAELELVISPTVDQ